MLGNFQVKCWSIFVLASLLLITIGHGLNSEGQFLLDLKNSLDDEFNNLENWKSTDETPCGWVGINCTTIDYEPVVWSVDLSWMNLSGTLSPNIGGLTGLTYLDLSNNRLYANGLMGQIPMEIGNLKSLKKLYLYRNGLNGSIPREIGNLRLATEIDLSDNCLIGEIPSELSNIKDLRILNLYQNRLTGVIPIELGSLRNLTKLDLSSNGLIGPIPYDFQYLTEMIHLQLFSNSLSGTIPPHLGAYSPLRVVDFSDNELVGQIPQYLCQQTNLILLNLGANILNGPISSGITRCKTLVTLRLAGNILTGTFPSELCQLLNLTTIELDRNNFTGSIPSDIGNCRRLQRLHIAENQFTDELPMEVSNLSQLVSFNVSSNFLSGRIPPEIVNCKMLQRVDLSRNNFFDTLPNEVGTLSQLEIFKLSENNFSGNIPPSLGKLSHLIELQMGGNNFWGEIPRELASLSSLQIAMNLSYNNLTGNVPPELGHLNMLEFLLLNNNNLSGIIPSTFENLLSLSVCNLSYNNLTGALPSFALFQKMPATCFIENNGLCGRPLHDCPQDPSSPSSVLHSARKIIIIAVISGFIGGFGIALILIVYIFYITRHNQREIVASPEDDDSDIYFQKEGFTFEDIVEFTENFHEKYIVGKGAFGTVYKAVVHSELTFAVKRLASNAEKNKIVGSFRAEILTHEMIRHRNIVKLFGYCCHKGSNLLIYEYIERGSLAEVLHGASCSLEWSTRFTIALGAAEGLSYIHHDCKPSIVHRHINSNSILLDTMFEAHICGFGSAKVLIDMPQEKSESAVVGSYGYIAPEYAYTMKATEKCDIYSYGVVLLELLTGKTPVQILDEGGNLVTLVRDYVGQNSSTTVGILDDRLNLDDQTTVAHMITVLEIALECTSDSPFDRPSMREVVKMLIKSNEIKDKFIMSPYLPSPSEEA